MTTDQKAMPEQITSALTCARNNGICAAEYFEVYNEYPADTLLIHITALEAENKRLRDIIKELVENERRNNLCDPDMLPTERHIEETWDKAKSAIAQTGEK